MLNVMTARSRIGSNALGSIYAFEQFELDVDNQELRRAGEATRIDGLVLRLLEEFVRRPGQLITKEELMARVWNGRPVSENSLTVAVTRLRKALRPARDAPQPLMTVHGHGYRFTPEVVTRDSQAIVAGRDLSARVVPPFVGRERLMGQLAAAMMEARDGSGSAVVLSGEAGIGKTRVAEVLAREAHGAAVAVAWAHCRELDGMSPLWPFAGLLREVLTRLPPDALGSDPRWSALVPDLARLIPELASGVAPAQEAAEEVARHASKHRVFEAVTRAFVLAAEHVPRVLIVDDLGRADGASLELLNYLLPELPRSRILLVATLRSDGVSPPDPQLARVLDHRCCTHVRLPPLREAPVASYVLALLGHADAGLTRAVFEKSGGNPLFMAELVRQLRGCERPDVTALTTPSVAIEWIRQRISGLDTRAHEVLICAAVIGRDFDLPLIQSITGRPLADLMASLDAAIEREIVLPARDSPTEFVFAHDLVRDALYETLDPQQRRDWHLRVVEALDARLPLGQVLVADLVFHARAALPEGDLRKTVHYCVEASNAAARVYAYPDAARYLQHARQTLELIPDASPRFRFALLWRQAAYVRGYSASEFAPLAEQLLRVARGVGRGVALARVAMLMDSFPGFPPLPGTRTALAESLAALPENAPHTRAAVAIRLATSAPLCRLTEERGQIESSIKLARGSTELDECMTALIAELYLYGGPAHKPRAQAALRELERICRENATTLTLASALLDLHRTVTALQEGDLGTMLRALERSEARCRECDLDLLWHVERFRALARIYTGHAAEGRATLAELHRRAPGEGPIPGIDVFCAYDQCVVLGDGQQQGAERTLEPDADDPPHVWAMKVRAWAARGAIDEARSALSAVPAAALRQLTCDRDCLGTLGALARAALAVHAPDHARVTYELLRPYPEYFAVNGSFVCEGSVSELLGMLAHSFGELQQAREHFDDAIAASDRAGLVTCAADARRKSSEVGRISR